MKSYKKALLAGVILGCMPMMTACSFKETLGILWNGEEKEQDSQKSASSSLDGANIDENVEVPVLNNELGEPVTYGLGGKAEPLTIDASVEDGGTLSYQWYRNNVNSNGGGTAIDGAVENSYTPPTSESGTTYYYVVVTNTIGKGIQLAVSTTKCVTVTQEAEADAPDAEGTWKQSEKGWWFEYTDGTYPSNKWEHINGEWYAFDENGIMRTGWYQEGDKWYYFQSDGVMAHDTDVDGYHLGSDGVMQ